MQFMFAALKLELGDTLYYLLIFAALLLLVKHFAWGPVTKMMEERRQKVISDLDQADSDRKKAELLANQREAALKDSKHKFFLLQKAMRKRLRIILLAKLIKKLPQLEREHQKMLPKQKLMHSMKQEIK